jgi:hypothetical protein
MRSFDVLHNWLHTVVAFAAGGGDAPVDETAEPTGLHAVLDPIVEAVKPYTLDPLDRMLDAIPMGVAQAIVIGLFVVAAVVCCCLRRKYVYMGAPDQKAWRDLRLWSVLLVIPYILVYIVFGL